MPGDIFGKLILPVIPDDPIQRLLIIVIHDIPRCQLLPLIHAHVKRRITLVGEPPLHRVKLIRGHTEIEDDAIYVLYALSPQCLSCIAVIIPDNGNFFPKFF